MIESINPETLPELLPLIRQYQSFYQIADIDDQRNRDFFAQFSESNASGCQFAYRKNGKIIGFATVYFTFVSSIPAKVAVMNDLFIVEAHRGQGVGRALIEHCRAYATTHGAARLQWLTAADNEKAQRLYDALDTKKSSWLSYVYPTQTA